MNVAMPCVVVLNVVMSFVVGPYRRTVLPTVGRLVALLTNIRLGRKNLDRLVYFRRPGKARVYLSEAL